MPVGALFNIEFQGIRETQDRLTALPGLLEFNLRIAVARTVLWGAGKIAEDCPIDTGLLRASIGGMVVNTATGGKAAAQGRTQSLTTIDGLLGVIGTAVHYAIHQEFGFTATGPKKLTAKQLRFLFAVGVLRRGPGGRVIPGNHPRRLPSPRPARTKTGRRRRRIPLQTHAPLPGSGPQPKGAVPTTFGVDVAINRRAGIKTHVKGRGFFRRNIPAIRSYFFAACEEAVSLAMQGKEMVVSAS